MANPADSIKHDTLAALVQTGAVRHVDVIGIPGGWSVLVGIGGKQLTLTAKRGGVRRFAQFETAASYLKELGLTRLYVDSTGWAPQSAHDRRRPDVAARWRETYAHSTKGKGGK